MNIVEYSTLYIYNKFQCYACMCLCTFTHNNVFVWWMHPFLIERPLCTQWSICYAYRCHAFMMIPLLFWCGWLNRKFLSFLPLYDLLLFWFLVKWNAGNHWVSPGFLDSYWFGLYVFSIRNYWVCENQLGIFSPMSLERILYGSNLVGPKFFRNTQKKTSKCREVEEAFNSKRRFVQPQIWFNDFLSSISSSLCPRCCYQCIENPPSPPG